MTVVTEARHAGEFLVYEDEVNYSRENIVLASGQNLPAGAVIGKITASGKWASADPAETDGSENAAGVLLYPVDATAADVDTVAIVRHAVVNANLISYHTGATTGEKAANVASLKALGVLVR